MIARPVVSALLISIGVVLAAAPAATAADAPVASLSPGEHAFWDGPHVEQATVGTSELCNIAGPCWSYTVEVEPGRASRLRVAIDWAANTDWYALELIDPSGKVVAYESGRGSWSDEVYAARPKAGDWTVRVIPEDVTASSFKARAKLERPAGKPARPKLLRPNMQVTPPWQPGLVAPAAPFSGRPASVVGFQPFSCTLDETIVNGTQRCLRFSVGPANIGKGPYEARMDLATAEPTGEGRLEGTVVQRLYRTDGSHVDRDAGRYVFHETHAHFHVSEMLSYQLFRVTDQSTGTLEPAGEGRKASFCTLDLMIADFARFTNERAKFRGPTPCAVPPEGDSNLVMGVSPGWADVYTWDLPDQYVDFDAGGEGHFVIRVNVDQSNTILETNEQDNVGYAHVRVAGGEVEVLERGLGLSPWDPNKTVHPPAP
jgi:hypothetical protein